MIKLHLIGRTTKDCELSKTANGITYCNFDLACKGKYKDESGNIETEFFHCKVWRGIAENLVKYCKKGDLLAVTGVFKSRSYEDKNGQQQRFYEVTVDDIEFLTTKAERDYGEEKAREERERKLQPVDDDDLPF